MGNGSAPRFIDASAAQYIQYLTQSALCGFIIKSINGSDAVTVEAKYHAPYTTKINCKLVFGTNHPIRATVEDRALARRLMVLPFSNSIPKEQQDPYLLNRLLEERPAILYRAIQAYKELKANKYIFEGDDLFGNDTIMGIESVVTTAENTIVWRNDIPGGSVFLVWQGGK